MQREWDWVVQWCMSYPQNYITHSLIDNIDYVSLDVMTVHWPSGISDSCIGSLSLACHILSHLVTSCHILSPRFWLIGPLAVLASAGSMAVNRVIAGADFRHPVFSKAWEGHLELPAVRKAGTSETCPIGAYRNL